MEHYKNPFLKIAGTLLFVILALWIIQALLFGLGFGINVGFGGNHGGGYMYMGTGIGLAGLLTGLLYILIKVLFVLFVVGLVIGTIISAKNLLFTEEDIRKLKNTFSTYITSKKETCTTCGKGLDNEWKACPYCGTSKQDTKNTKDTKDTTQK